MATQTFKRDTTRQHVRHGVSKPYEDAPWGAVRGDKRLTVPGSDVRRSSEGRSLARCQSVKRKEILCALRRSSCSAFTQLRETLKLLGHTQQKKFHER